MKAEEILSIDFSKYNKVSINGVFLDDVDIEVEDHLIQVYVSGKSRRDGYSFMMTSFNKDDEVRMYKLSEDHLSLREVKKCIYCAK